MHCVFFLTVNLVGGGSSWLHFILKWFNVKFLSKDILANHRSVQASVSREDRSADQLPETLPFGVRYAKT